MGWAGVSPVSIYPMEIFYSEINEEGEGLRNLFLVFTFLNVNCEAKN